MFLLYSFILPFPFAIIVMKFTSFYIVIHQCNFLVIAFSVVFKIA